MIEDGITLKKLEIFLAFMRSGNLGRTAEALSMSTVSVHKAIHSLEETLGCPLFVHEGRVLVPLQSAYSLEAAARQGVDAIHQGVLTTRRQAGVSQGIFRLGGLYSLTVEAIPELLNGLKARRPTLSIELGLGSNQQLLERLRRLELDAALVCLNESTTEKVWLTLPLFEDALYLATPHHALTPPSEGVDLSRYGELPFIQLSSGFATTRDSQRVFDAAGIAPPIAMQVDDIFTVMSLVNGGVGYALLPGRMRAVFQGRISLHPLAERYRLSQQVGLVILSSREREADMLALLAEARLFAGRQLDH